MVIDGEATDTRRPSTSRSPATQRMASNAPRRTISVRLLVLASKSLIYLGSRHHFSRLGSVWEARKPRDSSSSTRYGGTIDDQAAAADAVEPGGASRRGQARGDAPTAP